MIGRLLLLMAAGSAAWSATVSGQVELTVSNSGTDQKKDNSGAVVWLEPVAGTAPETPAVTVSMAHHNKTFVPHVVAVRTGSKVRFPNLDPFFHNAFSNYDGQIVDIGLHAPKSYREVTFRRPGVVHLFCNIHPTMSAVIMVLNTPWFAVSDKSGSFRIAAVPPGEYQLKVFHERALPDVLAHLEHRLTVQPDDLALPPMVISEAGYVAPPHKNKYGKDYPPGSYPGPKP
jgi:plastocyanin